MRASGIVHFIGRQFHFERLVKVLQRRMQLSPSLVKVAHIIESNCTQLQTRLVIGQVLSRLGEELCLFEERVGS